MSDREIYGVYLGKDHISTYFKDYVQEITDITLNTLNVSPGKDQQTINAPLGSAYSSVVVAGDNNLVPANIRAGVSIFGVAGEMTQNLPANLTTAVVAPASTSQYITPGSGYDGFSAITITGVTSDIDPDIIPSNIKAGVNILGVVGTLSSEGTQVSGTLNITSNGNYDVSNYANVYVNITNSSEIPDGYILPTGEYTVSANGTYNINNYSTVKVNVPIPAGYIQPSGSTNITANGSGIDVAQYSTVNVNVPIPSGYIQPSGTKSITSNGSYIDVKDYAYVNVNVATAKPEQSKTVTPITSQQTIYPDSGYALSSVTVNAIPSQYVIPSGTQYITANTGENGIDISSKQKVVVNVPIPSGYIQPSGSQTITDNGTYDITNKSTVVVNIQKETHNFVYSSTQPVSPTEGLVWFKPI